jgi:DNA polymerase delta subunit 3
MDAGNGSDNDEMNLIFDNIDEWLNDEDKVVTYRWLSLTLNLHVNYAKHILDAFVKSDRGQKLSLAVTYCLSGHIQQSDDSVYKVFIVQSDEREAVTATISSPVSSHIYSIQKTRLKNPDMLYSADFDLIKCSGLTSAKLSAITCPLAVLKPRIEHAVKTTDNSSQPQTTLTKSSLVSSAVSHSTGQPVATSMSTGKATTTSKAANSGFGRLFGNVTKKKTESVTETTANVTAAVVSHSQTSSSDVKLPAVTSTCVSTKSKPCEKSNTQEQLKQAKNKATSSSTGLNRRRRILQMSSSDEDDDVVLSSAEELPASPEPQVNDRSDEPMEIVATEDDGQSRQQASTEGHSEPQQVMQRKLVSKTYVNEEGFMVTEKVWESEMVQSSPPTGGLQSVTAPPASISVQHKKVTDKKSTTTVAPSTAATCTKQSSLTKFFQKK